MASEIASRPFGPSFQRASPRDKRGSGALTEHPCQEQELALRQAPRAAVTNPIRPLFLGGTSAGSPRRPQAPATEPDDESDPAAMQRSNISQRARALGWTLLDPPSPICPADQTRRRPLFSMTLR